MGDENQEDYPVLGGYCTSPELFVKKTGKPHPFGILSEVIFGGVTSYRCSCGNLKNKILDKNQVCPKCHVICADNILRLKTFGKIKYVSPVIKTTRKNDIIKLIGKENKQLLEPKQSDANAALNRYLTVSQDKSEIRMIRDPSDCPPKFIFIPFRICGIYSLIYVFQFLAEILKIPIIKDLFDNNYIIDEIDVLPPDVRPVFKDPNKANTLRYEEINKFYISLLNSNKRNKIFYPTMKDEIKIWTEKLIEKFKNNDYSEITDISTLEYDQIAAFYQYYTDMIYDWCFKHIKGKEGLVRSTVLSRTLEFSGRTVVAVDPNCKPYELKAPREMLFTLWLPYFLNYLVSKRIMKFDECYYRIVEKKYYELKQDSELYGYFLDFLDWFNTSSEAQIIE